MVTVKQDACQFSRSKPHGHRPRGIGPLLLALLFGLPAIPSGLPADGLRVRLHDPRLARADGFEAEAAELRIEAEDQVQIRDLRFRHVFGGVPVHGTAVTATGRLSDGIWTFSGLEATRGNQRMHAGLAVYTTDDGKLRTTDTVLRDPQVELLAPGGLFETRSDRALLRGGVRGSFEP